MNRISNQDVIAVFESLGFKQHTIKGNVLFEKDGAYYRLSYINENMGYVIESADNIEEAKIGRFEDDDVIALQETKEKTIEAIKTCLEEYY